jgi:sulfate permease, SulP family
LTYARVDGVRFVATGRDLHSRNITPERRSQMAERGEAIAVIKLAGFMFFGTADRIVQRIVGQSAAAGDRTEASNGWYAILDFSRVAGFDSSTVLSFERLRRIAERDGFRVVFAGLGPLADRLAASGLDIGTAPFHRTADLDAALSWAEGQVLGVETATHGETVAPQAALSQLLGDAALADAILPCLTHGTYRADERLILQGTAADDILIVESGHGAVLLETRGDGPLALMDFGPGTILGEIAFYGREARSASAVARTPVVAWTLSRTALDTLEAEQPAAAAAFHRALARVLADRLQSANRLIRVLAD